MTKYNIGDRVLVANPAYLVMAGDAEGFVSTGMFGAVGKILRVLDEDSGSLVGQAYSVQAEGSDLQQTISQRYLSPASEPAKPTTIFDDLEDGIYEVDGLDTFIVRRGEATFARCKYGLNGEDEVSGFDHNSTRVNGNVVRLVAPETKPAPDYPEDGAYVDTDGDLLVIADRKATWVNDFGRNGEEIHPDNLVDYGPLTPLVPEAK